MSRYRLVTSAAPESYVGFTKRDFDRATKRNYGAPMASDTRRDYRELRRKGSRVAGYLTQRMWALRQARHGRAHMPLFSVAFGWRAPARWAATQGRTLLTGRAY